MGPYFVNLLITNMELLTGIYSYDFGRLEEKFLLFTKNYAISQNVKEYYSKDRQTARLYSYQDARNYNIYRDKVAKTYPKEILRYPVIFFNKIDGPVYLCWFNI